jgi:hypothetical protein
MNIQSTRYAGRPAQADHVPSQKLQEATKESAPDSVFFSRDNIELGASALAGGVALGAGGAWLGANLGMAYAGAILEPIAQGQPPALALTKILAALPTFAAWTALGGIAGGAVGASAGSAIGFQICDSIQQRRE